MGLSPRDVGELSWHEFNAMSWNWSDLHDTDSDKPEPISAELYEAHLEKLARDGRIREH